jgi:uncharacterized protein (TIGR02453 family)
MARIATFYHGENRMGRTTFPGFGRDARTFFTELAKNNNRPWFKANQARYEDAVLAPAAAFVEDLGARLARTWPSLQWGTQRNGTGSIMRIHRDVRFSPDKRPCKENLGIVLWLGPGAKMERPAFYFNLDSGGAFFYAGLHAMTDTVLGRYRRAVDDETTGAALERLLGRLAAAGMTVMEEPAYQRVPRGYAPDHPRAVLLRHAGLGVRADVTAAETGDPGLPAACAAMALRARPLVTWLLALDRPGSGSA